MSFWDVVILVSSPLIGMLLFFFGEYILMFVITLPVLILSGAISLFDRLLKGIAGTNHETVKFSRVYECAPDTCSHEWEYVGSTEESGVVDYCSYGGSDTLGYWTRSHYKCPKCGSTKTETSDVTKV